MSLGFWLFTWAVSLAVAEPIGDEERLVRVEDPHHPDAIARSSTGAVLLAPPTDGTPWRWESIPETDAGPVSTVAADAIDAMGVASWHEAGRLGSGVKVAVFDLAWFSGDTRPDSLGPITTRDCFVSSSCSASFDVTRPSLTAESGAHGWACAETVHAVAPEAELVLVRVNSVTALENAVDWAIREGVDVISMSMSFYNDSFYDGGGPHGMLVERLERAGVLLVTSAGNNATQHWSGQWSDVDADGRLDGDDGAGRLVYWGAGEAVAYVNWDQWERCGTTDLTVQLVDQRGWVVGESAQVQDPDDPSCEPFERLRATLPEGGWYRLEVQAERGPTDGLSVDLLARGGALLSGDPHGALTDPASHPWAFAVGAVWVGDYSRSGLESFSAWGPSHGGVAKPDVVGPDGLSTARRLHGHLGVHPRGGRPGGPRSGRAALGEPRRDPCAAEGVGPT